MSDNVKVNPGQEGYAITVATDDIGGIHYPIYKVSYGADGAQTPVDADNPLPTENKELIASKLETDNDMLNLLNDVLSELKIMNLYNAMTHNQELTKEDLG